MLIRLIIQVILVLIPLAQKQIQAQPFQILSLDSILKNEKGIQGINLQSSRECALLFHQKLNVYRKSKRKQTLTWNDTIWLAALNHAIYIDANNHFSHIQRKNGKFFSGITPDRRWYFVLGKSDVLMTSGENIFIYVNKQFNSEVIAEAMFQAWKQSSGHNKNMLDSDFEMHAVAVLEGKNGITCTSMFIAYPEYTSSRSGNNRKKSKKWRVF